MPDDGGWLSGPEEARAARVRFEEVLAEFTRRLASPEPMRRETAVALVQQMERLARRMGADEDALNGRVADLSAALSALNVRLQTELAAAAAREAQLTARLDRTLAELAEARAAKRPLVGAGAIRLVLAAAGLCAVLYGAVAGVTALTRPKASAATAATPVDSEPAAEAYAPITAPTLPTPPPPAAIPLAAAPPSAPSPRPSLEPFSTVMTALERGEPTAVRRLTALAGSGDAKAQLQLARLYETGDAGLAQDMGAARRWTLRAARGGDRAAMYNAAVFLMEGDGGPKDVREAAAWFRRAAERGVTDAQYNLGLMYEAGQGVEPSPSEARRWLGLAAKSGDGAAATKLAEMDGPPAALAAATDDPSVTDTQRYLAQKGYYVGPIDGVVSPVLTAAAKAYVRDHPESAPAI